MHCYFPVVKSESFDIMAGIKTKYLTMFVALAVVLLPAFSAVAKEDGGEVPVAGLVILNQYKSMRGQQRPATAHLKEQQKTKPEGLKNNLSISLESDFRSKYQWRGVPLSKGLVWQPSGSIELYGLGLTVWGNFVLNDEANQGQFNEIDFVPYYTFTVHGLTISPSLEIYIYPNDNPASLNYTQKTSFRGNLHLSYTIGHFGIFGDTEVDLYSAKGALYIDFGTSFHYQIIKPLSLDTSILFAIGSNRFNRAHFANVGTQLNLFQYNLGISWNPWKALKFTPNFHVSTFLPPSLRRGVGSAPTQIWGGLDIAYDF